jgi:hypothetical protein
LREHFLVRKFPGEYGDFPTPFRASLMSFYLVRIVGQRRQAVRRRLQGASDGSDRIARDIWFGIPIRPTGGPL